MDDFTRLLGLAIGSIVLGVGLTIAVLTALASRYSDNSSSEGCFGTVMFLATLVIALFFFVQALTGCSS